LVVEPGHDTDQHVRDIAVDRTGNVWFALATGGASVYTSEGEWVTFTESDGLIFARLTRWPSIRTATSGLAPMAKGSVCSTTGRPRVTKAMTPGSATHLAHHCCLGTSRRSLSIAGDRSGLTNHEVQAILQQSADDLGEQGLDRHYGYGLINAQWALETVTPTTALVPDQSRCIEIECGAAAALQGEPDEAALLTTLRTVRDQLLTQHPRLRWRAIYYTHQTEVFWLVMADAQLRAIGTLHPLLVALLNDRHTATPITDEMVAQTERVIMTLAQRGSPALHDDLLDESQRLDPTHFVGWTGGAAWQELLADAQSDQLYLPLTIK
jgi:hypothetical protein